MEPSLTISSRASVAEQEMSIAAVLANRLHNTIRLTSSSFQAARLLLLLERVIKLLGDDVVAMPSSPVGLMKHTCQRLSFIMDEIQAMCTALRAPLVSHL